MPLFIRKFPFLEAPLNYSIAQMFHGLGNGGAASLLGGIAIIMACIPFAFAKWGKKIRARSKRAAL